MRRPVALLAAVQGLLERTYAMRTGIDDPARFVIGDRGYSMLYGTVVRTLARPGAMTLVRETESGLRATIYFPDDMIRRLEQSPPQMGLCEDNVDDFATLVEELDHLLLLAERHRQERPVTLFELELHANVSKYLVLTRFLAARGRRPAELRLWLRHHLFEKLCYRDEDPRVRARYRDAAGWAVRFLNRLPPLSRETRLRTLRRFHAASTQGKIELIQRTPEAYSE